MREGRAGRYRVGMIQGTSSVGTVLSSHPAWAPWDNSGLRARLGGRSSPRTSFVSELQVEVAEREATTPPERSRRGGKHRPKRR